MKKFTIAILTLAFLSGCVTQKKKEDISPIKKFYHDITAEFNGYFNATEILSETYVSMSEQEPENYNTLLPIYPYVEVENPQAAAPELDEAIKKVTIVNALHEPSHWVDDCYLLAGKAQYLKQDYEAAEETFEYLVSEFSPEAKLNKAKKSKAKKPRSKAESQKVRKEREKVRKKEKQEKEKSVQQKRKEYKKAKKEREKERARERKERERARKKGQKLPRKTTPKVEETPAVETNEPETPAVEEVKEAAKEEEEPPIDTDEPSGPFAHKPAFQEGQLWLARTYIERDKFVQADYLLRQLNNNKKIYPEIASQLAVVTAHFFIKQKQYEQAIAPLERAIEMSKDRQEKARYSFILAQLYEMQDNSSEAFRNYEQVVKFKPKYEMNFSARMSMIINQYQAKAITSEEAVDNLEKLIKDEKNIDYLDRIYFSIAEIYLRKGDEIKGVEFLELALEEGGANEAQQAETCLTLADIYYKKEDYLKANDYYGRALAGLSKSDIRYNEVERLSKVLKDIAQRVETIERQDSLLRIADMTPDEKRAFAFERKKQQDEERRKAAIAAAQAPNTSSIGRPTRRPAVAGSAPARLTSSTQSDYWAYNDRAIKRGQRDFRSKWGDRDLGDDWRRSSRSSGGGIQSDTTSNIVATQALSDAQVADMLRGVPQSKAQMEQANEMIEDAMFELGVLYKDKLEKPKKAVETLEALLSRSPDNKHAPEAMYHLYLLHKDLGNSSEAQRYYDQLVNKYSDTVFAKVLTDPNFINNLNKEEQALTIYYDQTYEQFNKGEYKAAYERLQGAEAKFGTDHPLQAKFALLNAMALGSVEGKEAYTNTLKKVIAEYPNTDEQKRAREILRLLGEANSGAIGQSQNSNNNQIFKYEPDKMHFIVIALPPDVSLTDAKIGVSNFNRKYYQLENFRVSNIYLTPEDKERFPILVIRRFKNANEAVSYCKSTILNANDFIQMDFEIFPVTQNNYRQIIRNKGVEAYRDFFELNYDY